MASGPFTVGAGLSQGNQHGSGAAAEAQAQAGMQGGIFAGIAERLQESAQGMQQGRAENGQRDSKLRRGTFFGRSPSPKGHPNIRKTRKSRSPFARDFKERTSGSSDPWGTYLKSKGTTPGGQNSGGIGGENSAQGNFQQPPTQQPPQGIPPTPPPGLGGNFTDWQDFFKALGAAMSGKKFDPNADWKELSATRNFKRFPALDERYFRRVDKFSGTLGKFKS